MSETMACGAVRHPRPPHAIVGCERGCVTVCAKERATCYDDGGNAALKIPTATQGRHE
jgi:hypothetical protein